MTECVWPQIVEINFATRDLDDQQLLVIEGSKSPPESGHPTSNWTDVRKMASKPPNTPPAATACEHLVASARGIDLRIGVHLHEEKREIRPREFVDWSEFTFT